ncbi:hypothetical protein L609_000300002340 [Bacillus subtilis J22]|nr:hypothetical protein L604_000400001860 [Bacillus subtilis J27]TWH27767.1 hypothetical protein L609_000300002340 [Bacillus subtilis J22]
MTADGTELISAEILPIKPKQRAITAAPPMTKTLNTLVMASTPMFSP